MHVSMYKGEFNLRKGYIKINVTYPQTGLIENKLQKLSNTTN